MDRHVRARRRVVRALAGALTVSALLAPAAFGRPAPADAFGSDDAGSIRTLADSTRARARSSCSPVPLRRRGPAARPASCTDRPIPNQRRMAMRHPGLIIPAIVAVAL